MNKITIDMSDFIGDTYYNVKPHKEYCYDKNGLMLRQYATELIDEISGEFNFIPLIDSNGIQYREIREVKA